jgi:hypothetical protein
MMAIGTLVFITFTFHGAPACNGKNESIMMIGKPQ